MKIVDKFVDIKINSRNIKHLISKGYEGLVVGKTISIEPIHLMGGSSMKVNVLCDVCEEEKNVHWSFYSNVYKKDGYYCCSSCKSSKSKVTNIKRYGSTTPLGNKKILKKLQKTNLEKYGNVCSLHNEGVKSKTKKTFSEKWGGDIGSHMKSEEMLNKIENVNIEKYGFKYPTQNKKVSDKIKKTNLEKYGVDNVSKMSEIINKIEKTHKEKYGDWYFNSIHFDKDEHNGIYYKSDKFLINHLNNVDTNRFKDTIVSYKGSSMWELKCVEGHVYEIKSDLYLSRSKSNITTCLECVPKYSESGSSLKEKELLNIISNYTKVDSNNRDMGFEIDIYLPDHKIGIEFNGLYWHSDIYKDKKYHLNKTTKCSEKGIELIHVWEDEWVFKKDILMSYILNKLKITKNKIYARKCVIKEVNSTTKNNFLEKNHLQGKCKSSKNYGLYYGDELVSLMTFGKRNINNSVKYELIRFCNKLNTNVVGGSSRLFKHFLRNNKDIKEIISYSDNSKYTGDMYDSLGFSLYSEGVLNYYWVSGVRRYHRFIFNKKKLIKEGYDPNMTEDEIMRSRSYYKLWGCGHKKWVYHI